MGDEEEFCRAMERNQRIVGRMSAVQWKEGGNQKVRQRDSSWPDIESASRILDREVVGKDEGRRWGRCRNWAGHDV